MPTWYANVTNIDGSVTLYNLSDRNPFKLLSITGIGNAEIRRLEERGPFQDGTTDVGYRVDPRTLTLVIQVYGSSASDADTQRDKLASIFSPIANAPIRLYVQRDDGTTRQIDTYAVSQVDMPAQLPDRILNSQRVMVQLRAPNPFWYDPVIKYATFTASAIPVSEWWTGNGLIGSSDVIYYGTAIAQGGTVVASSAAAIFYRSARPTSGTSVIFDLRGTGSLRYAFYTRNAADYSFAIVPTTTTSAGTVSGSNYGTAGGSAVFALDKPSFPNHEVVQYASSTETAIFNTTRATWSGPGTLTWRQNSSGGSVWANSVSHAALYRVPLSSTQRAAVAALVEPSSQLIMSGSALLTGNWREYPIISLTGPAENPVVVNQTTGETLSFAGTLAGSTSWVIDTRYGYKTVTQGGSSVINLLSDDSDLATFHFQPGANLIQVLATGGTTASTQANIQYYDRFLSA